MAVLALVDSRADHKRRVLTLIVALSKPFYMSKAVDVFLDLPEPHQKGLCEYLIDYVDNDNLTKLKSDSGCLDVFKGAMFLYAGSESKNELNVNDFKRLIVDYVKSTQFEKADSSVEISNDEIINFNRELEEL